MAVIRIAGIYGPGQNALETVKAGRARRIVKPGQVFNRIHVGDLAGIIDGAVALAVSRRAGGIFNAADDEPTAPGDPIVYAAGLLEVEPPPEIAFEDAKKTMSPFAISFYGESKRVRNARIKSVLGVTLRYPTYREACGRWRGTPGGDFWRFDPILQILQCGERRLASNPPLILACYALSRRVRRNLPRARRWARCSSKYGVATGSPASACASSPSAF